MKKDKRPAIRFKAIREALGLKQSEIASGLDVAKPTISDLESGKYHPNFEIVSKLASVYNVNLYYLHFGTGEMFGEHFENSTGILASDDGTETIIANEEWIRFLRNLKRSPFLLLSVMSNYRGLMAREKDIIRGDFEKYEMKEPD